MIKELPSGARECSVSGTFITKDAKVLKQCKTGFKEIKIRVNKSGSKSFYDSSNKCYVSLVHEYASVFVENPEQKPLAIVKDADSPLSEDNILWVTSKECEEYVKAHAKRQCKCCGSTIDKSMIGELCKQCFKKMSNAKSDTAEMKRFKDRVAATGFDPEKDRFSGRQRDVLELYCSGVSIAKIAKVVGCDQATAKACIMSAKQARLLEKMSSENVTEIGYKTLADVLPAESETKSERVIYEHSNAFVSEPIVLQSIVIDCDLVESEPIEKPYSIVQEAVNGCNYFREPRVQESVVSNFNSDYLKFVDDIVHQLVYDPVQDAVGGGAYFLEPHVQECKPVEFSSGYNTWISHAVAKLVYDPIQDALSDNVYFCEPRIVDKVDIVTESQHSIAPSTHRLAQRRGTRRRVRKHTVFIPDGLMFDSHESIHREAASCVNHEPRSFEDRSTLNLDTFVCPGNNTVSMDGSSTDNLASVYELYEAYQQSGYSVDFSIFCKVYWVACLYTSQRALQLTWLTLMEILNCNLEFNTQNINATLKLGMEVIDGW